MRCHSQVEPDCRRRRGRRWSWLAGNTNIEDRHLSRHAVWDADLGVQHIDFPPIASCPRASPRRFRSALRAAVRRSLASGRALRALISKLTGSPRPARSTEPLTPSVPGPARPCKLVSLIVLPAASMQPVDVGDMDTQSKVVDRRVHQPGRAAYLGARKVPPTLASSETRPVTRRPLAVSSGSSIARSSAPTACRSIGAEGAVASCPLTDKLADGPAVNLASMRALVPATSADAVTLAAGSARPAPLRRRSPAAAN